MLEAFELLITLFLTTTTTKILYRGVDVHGRGQFVLLYDNRTGQAQVVSKFYKTFLEMVLEGSGQEHAVFIKLMYFSEFTDSVHPWRYRTVAPLFIKCAISI